MVGNLVQLRQIDLNKEIQRISNIKVVRVRCKKLGREFPDRITFEFTHIGKSVVRANGKLFAFEPERGTKDNEAKRAARVTFETDGGIGGRKKIGWRVEGEIGILDDEALSRPPSLARKPLTTLLARSRS
jgi:hypothetical protein